MITARHLPETARAYDWRDDAACRSEDPELMYPGPGDTVAIEDAKTVCARCPVPVAEQCFADVMRAEGNASRAYRFGVRAGLTPGQRRALYEQRIKGRSP